jgi:hypothetical protein
MVFRASASSVAIDVVASFRGNDKRHRIRLAHWAQRTHLIAIKYLGSDPSKRIEYGIPSDERIIFVQLLVQVVQGALHTRHVARVTPPKYDQLVSKRHAHANA